jgi:hypothetical protein
MTVQLGIVVVCVGGEDDRPLLELHLDFIRRLTDVRYTIYAGVDRLAAPLVELLAQDPSVRPLTFGAIPERDSLEHSHYLTLLTERALADGVTHVAHLHMDSFPVRPGWARELAEECGAECALAGVAASELGQEGRPRVSGMLVPRTFYDTYGPVVSLAAVPRNEPDYRAYSRQFVGEDSGDPYGYLLARHNLPWRRLVRSNAREDHYLLGGLYGDVFFHLGAASRPVRRFPPKRPSRTQFRGLQWLRRTGRRLLPEGLRERVPDALRGLLNPDGANVQANNDAFAQIRERLLTDPEGYLAYLRGVT